MEIFAAILTLICVFLLNKQNILGWPIGIIAATLYIFVFWKILILKNVFGF
jgi:nicotinamide riboside transporter PnuC